MGVGRAGVSAALVSLAACAGARATPTSRSAQVAEGATLTAAQVDRVHALAPDYVARAERAELRASEAATPEVASEHHACAQLLLEAAQAEADRVELERRLLIEELRRDAVSRELAAEEYARVAQAQAAPVLPDPAVAAPTKSPDAQRMAAEAYIRRARLSLAAARVLGAEPAAIAQAERRVRDASERPAQARGALEQAQRVLDAARARNTPSTVPH